MTENCLVLYVLFLLLTVLVAHGGFDADATMIQGNLERNEMGLDALSKANLRFGDTYLLARKVW